VGEDRRRSQGHTANQRRVSVREVAVALGISEGAVRMRVKRGTLPSAREGGRLYVLLEHDPKPDPERTHDRTHDRTNELITTLPEQLEAERQGEGGSGASRDVPEQDKGGLAHSASELRVPAKSPPASAVMRGTRSTAHKEDENCGHSKV
jgi:hypothetical protein